MYPRRQSVALSKHRAQIVQLYGCGQLLHAVFEVRAAHARRRFRPQTYRGLIAIFKGIHLLRDDIGLAADSTRKQVRKLKDWWPNFAEAEGGEHFAGILFDAIPQFRFRREQVPGTFDCLKLCSINHQSLREIPYSVPE